MRPLNLQALDKLGELGNRAYGNPFLKRATELFWSPLGIKWGGLEIALAENAAGRPPPLYWHKPSFDIRIAREAGNYVALFDEILNAGGKIDLTSSGGIYFGITLGKNNVLLSPEAVVGYEEQLNGLITQTEGFFRAFLSEAVLALAEETGHEELQKTFLADPALFADKFAQSLVPVEQNKSVS